MQIDMKRVDPEINMDRFYCVEFTKDLFGAHGIHRQWGPQWLLRAPPS